MNNNEDWFEKYEKIKHLLMEPEDFNTYYDAKKRGTLSIDQMVIGKVNIPTGKLLVCDPLVAISESSPTLYDMAPKGKFDLEICVVKGGEYGDRYATARIRFNEHKAVSFRDALFGNEDFENVEPGAYFGFDVSAGMACICDSQTRDAYLAYEKEWSSKNDSNIYDGLLAKLFADNAKKNPNYQRQGGDWLDFAIPNSDQNIIMFQSGFGDGGYPIYWGYDEQNKICQIIVQFIDLTEFEKAINSEE